MKQAVKFSIIVPNYNKGDYIEECLNSIYNQIYKNYEVIVIDDGSDDQSLEIIKKFDVPLYHTDHLQAGGARNVGLCHCSGDYVVFLDSDDYLTDPFVLEKLSQQIDDHDIIFLNFNRDRYGEIEYIKDKNESLSEHIASTSYLGCPTKCFKRELLNGLSFPEKKRYEDIRFTMEAMCKAKSYTYFEEPFFNYRKVENSNSSATVDENAMLDILEEYINLYRLLIKYPQYKKELLVRINKAQIPLRLEVLNKLLVTGINVFDENFR